MKPPATEKRRRGRPKSPPEVRDGWMRNYTIRLPRDLAEFADRNGGGEYVRRLLTAAQIDEQIL